jgi:hypothetical protein
LIEELQHIPLRFRRIAVAIFLVKSFGLSFICNSLKEVKQNGRPTFEFDYPLWTAVAVLVVGVLLQQVGGFGVLLQLTQFQVGGHFGLAIVAGELSCKCPDRRWMLGGWAEPTYATNLAEESGLIANF